MSHEGAMSHESAISHKGAMSHESTIRTTTLALVTMTSSPGAYDLKPWRP